MSLGNVLGAAAPIAAGYMFPGFGASLGLGSGIAAGALTGAGIAALTGQDPLMGGITGGLGGMGGGGISGAIGEAGAASIPQNVATTATENAVKSAAMGYTGPTSMMSNPALTQGIQQGAGLSNLAQTGTFNPALNSQTLKAPATLQANNANIINRMAGTPQNLPMDKLSATTNAPPGMGGYSYTPSEALSLQREVGIGDVASKLGDGNKALGYGKMALTASGPVMAAFEPEVQTFDELRGDKYDPTRRLNLDEIDTGIGAALKRDTGLRLVKEGGHIKGYKGGGGLGLKSLMNSGNTQGSATNTSTGAVSDLSGQSILDMLRSKGIIKYENGGYLETGGRVGDGMSDDIKATINNEQEARLSDGEFVVPADVVSHLGNGSSDAGAKRLYDMMDKIRQARTGTIKQGREINPERYMPA